MNSRLGFSTNELRLVDRILKAYAEQHEKASLFRDQLITALSASQKLGILIHSIRSRMKDPEHLRDKLHRKIRKCKQEKVRFDFTPENLLVKINDLVGVRVLHLYTRQIRQIDAALREIFSENQYEVIEGPCARTWDDESRQFFRECNIATLDSPSMYTSVHYVVSSASRTKVTAEIQVRTLMEEVWGEVDHTVNYPHPSDSVGCREQLKVLARATSTATRLVDSIFATVEDQRTAARERRGRRLTGR
jgi:putative GTP pyrophosphokinase